MSGEPVIRCDPWPAYPGFVLSEIPAFPDVRIDLPFPEAIGDAADPAWLDEGDPWECAPQGEAGGFACRGGKRTRLSYTIETRPSRDHVDFRFSLTNESDRSWSESFAFNCVYLADADPFCDRDLTRHWVALDRRLTRLVGLPRHFGKRPSIQLYGVRGSPRIAEIPFAHDFDGAVDGLSIDGFFAVESRDRTGLVAVVSKPALFGFSNTEYSCVHSAASFGSLEPGRTGRAFTRVYVVAETVEEWHARMLREMATLEP